MALFYTNFSDFTRTLLYIEHFYIINLHYANYFVNYFDNIVISKRNIVFFYSFPGQGGSFVKSTFDKRQKDREAPAAGSLPVINVIQLFCARIFFTASSTSIMLRMIRVVMGKSTLGSR